MEIMIVLAHHVSHSIRTYPLCRIQRTGDVSLTRDRTLRKALAIARGTVSLFCSLFLENVNG